MTHWRPVSAGEREPAGTAIRVGDGVPVVFQYGQPIPSFDGRADVPETPDYLDLDGRWRFAFDPDDAGLGGRRHRLPGRLCLVPRRVRRAGCLVGPVRQALFPRGELRRVGLRQRRAGGRGAAPYPLGYL